MSAGQGRHRPASQAKPLPAPEPASSEVAKEEAPPEPPPETIKVRMHNATHGARHPGAVITLPAGQARELIRQGLAGRA